MTKEELSEVIEVVVASQTQMMNAAFDPFMPFLKPGAMLPGLVFKVEADEVRKLLRSRATGLREDAAEGEAGLAAVLEDVKKSFADDPSIDDMVEGAKKRTIDKIAHLRWAADKLDWQASHLDERSYMLGGHDLEVLIPEPCPDPGVTYDPLARFRAARSQVRTAGLGLGLPVR